MYKLIGLLVLGVIFVGEARADYSYESACARELNTFCRTAEYPRVQDCLMENGRRVSPECWDALQWFNLYNQEWYPDARIEWLRAWDYDRRRQY